MKTMRAALVTLVVLAACPRLAAQTTETYSFTNLNKTIPDGNPAGVAEFRTVPSSIVSISSLRVKLNISGNFNGDLYGYVTHSSGFTVLLNRPGKTAALPGGYDDSGFDITLQDGAANGDLHNYRSVSTPAAGVPLAGIWQPDARNVDPATVLNTSARTAHLSSFNGLSANGDWTLFLADLESGGTNRLNSWELQITGQALPVLTWANPGSIGYGTALGAAQLNASAGVPGSFAYSPASGTVLNAGNAQALQVIFTPTDLVGYQKVTNTVSINVIKAPLTITAQDKGKVYGAALPALTAAYSGFVNGDTAASLDTPASLSTTATAGSSVGNYPITVNGATDVNYAITFVSGAMAVGKAPLTITAQDKNKVYGAALPALTAAYSGFVNGDTAASLDTPVSLGTTATTASAVGAYPITASGAVDVNYTIGFVNGTLAVGKAPLTITAQDKNKVYGAALPALTAAYSGFVNGDTAASLDTPATLGTTATTGSSAGTYPITLGGAVDVNYTIAFVNGTLTVDKAALTITAQDKSKVYGAALPALTAVYSGFVNGDTSASLDTPVSLGTTATPASSVGTYPITASGAVDVNYTIGFVNGTLTVDKAALTITAQDKSKVYGAALPALTAAYSGFVNGDTSASLDTPVSLGTTATPASSVGTYPITASGAVDVNYTIGFVNGTLTVDKAALTITAQDKSKVYGAALPALTAAYSGFVNSDTAASLDTPVSLGTTATTASAVGAYPITASGAVDVNYTIGFVNGTLAVGKAPLTITAQDKNKVYGAALPALTAAYSGFVNGDTAASLDTPATLGTTATTGSSAGTYPITLGGAVDVNYTIAFVNGTLTVDKAALTITAQDKSKVYGAALPALTAVYSGFVNGDTSASLDTPVSLGTTATPASSVGTYPITASGAVDVNYTIGFVNGTLTVDKAALTITAQDKSKVYGAALPALTAAYSGFVNGDTSASLDTPVSLGTTAATGSPVGTYPITPSGAVDVNYTIGFVNGTLTVGKAGSTGVVGASANPVQPGVSVTFTFALSAVAPGAGTPSGSVQFKVDGVVAGSPAPLVGGTASHSTSSLSPSTHSVTAEYSGDANFTGATNSLSPLLVVNSPPVAGDDTMVRYPDQGVKILLGGLLSNDSDPDGHTVTLDSISSTSVAGGVISMDGVWVHYTPPAGYTNTDSFTYVVKDGHGGTATGTVNIINHSDVGQTQNLTVQNLGNGSYRVRFFGIPGRSYNLEYSESLVTPTWQVLADGIVNELGYRDEIDTPPAGSPTRYYRTVYTGP